MLENKELLAAAAAADEASLTALANKGIYKRAVKDIEGETPDFIEVGGQAVVTIGGAQCSITLPFENSRCTCPSRTVCRHIIAAILLLKAQASELPAEELPTQEKPPEPTVQEVKTLSEPETPEPADKPKKLSAAAEAEIRECAQMCSELIEGVLIHGLARVTQSASEDMELAAVRCHGAKMAEAERLMRELAKGLSDCASRRASFDSRVFTKRLIECSEYIGRLMTGELNEEILGSFRKKYDEHFNRLEILPIGHREVFGSSYSGSVYYFLNTDSKAKRRFLTYSDVRPNFYGKNYKRMPSADVWGTMMPMSSHMKKHMVLLNAKATDGRLSGSNETQIISEHRVNLNCPEVRKMVCCDFREAAAAMSERDPECEADTLFFVHPERLKNYRFDKVTQKLVMELEDSCGNTVCAEVKYKAETKDLVELLEKICERMQKNDGLFYTLLVSAYVSDGELRFYPVEVYDFLDGIEMHSYELPEKYKNMYRYSGSINKIVQVISAVDRRLETIMLSGLQSAGGDCTKLIKHCRDCGMEGLAQLTEAALKAAENYRHSTDSNAADVLEKMRKLMQYLSAAEKKAGTVSALCRMKGEN